MSLNFSSSEDGFSVTNYVKLQDAYVSELGDTLGSWKKLGYQIGTMKDSANGSTQNFSYADGITDAGGKKALSKTAATGWTATSSVALNECAKGEKWELKAASASNGNGAEWEAAMDDATNCEALTPQFKKVVSSRKCNTP